jgi:uncharacterized protein
MVALVDTSFLLALMNKRDAKHAPALDAMSTLDEEIVLCSAVLPELFYMLSVRVSYQSAVDAFTLLHTSRFNIQVLLAQDMIRMSEIMRLYASSEFDFVDTSLMALSERLNARNIYTFDHRDFRVFVPKHCPYLVVLPA